MRRESGNSLRLFVNPFSIWTDLALKTGQMMLTSAQAGAAAQSKVARESVQRTVAVLRPAGEIRKPARRAAKTKGNGNGRGKAKRRAKRR